VARFESDLEAVELTGPDHAAIRAALLRHAHDPEADLLQRVSAEAAEALEKLNALAHVRIAPPAQPGSSPDIALACLAEEFAKLHARRGARAEIEEAMEDMGGLADEGVTWRLSRAAEARHRADHPSIDDSDPGGDRAALSAELQRLIDTEVWIKRKE
jgi:DNA primase